MYIYIRSIACVFFSCVIRLSSMLSEREGIVSSQTERGAQIKLKALNKAMVKMAAQVEGMEHKNSLLTKKLKMVCFNYPLYTCTCMIIYMHIIICIVHMRPLPMIV